MITQVKIDSPETYKYWGYLLNEILKHSPLRAGELLEVRVNAKSTPIPIFEEVPTPPRGTEYPLYDAKGTIRGRAFMDGDPRQTINVQALNKELRFDSKITALWLYTHSKLAGMCKVHFAESSDRGPIKVTFYITIAEPKEIYKAAKRLKLEVPSRRNVSLKGTPTTAKLKRNPLRIFCCGKEIPITENTLQSRLCEIMFQKPVNTLVELIDLADGAYGTEIESPKEVWRNIYNALYIINRKVEKTTSKKIFKLGKMRYFRLA